MGVIIHVYFTATYLKRKGRANPLYVALADNIDCFDC